MEDQAIYRRGPDAIYPCNDVAFDKFDRMKIGNTYRGKFEEPRNSKFFRKWWKMIQFAYDHFEPSELTGKRFEGITPEKNLERFRKDVTILAGHYKQSIRLNGECLVEAKSIAWAKMSEEQFGEFYKASFNVIWDRVFIKIYCNEKELEDILYELNSFS